MRIGPLNGLRALAAFTVLISHCMMWSGWPGLGIAVLPDPAAAAALAVDAFMLLSGFLMVHTIDADADRGLRFWTAFFARRFFRIAPVYYVCLGVTLIALGPLLAHYAVLTNFLGWTHQLDGIDYSAANIALHLSFAFGLLPNHASSTTLPDWSLGLEMQFYVAFPLLALAMQRARPATIGLLSIPICLLAQAVWSPSFREPAMLLLKLPVFCSGMLLRYAIDARTARDRSTMIGLAMALPLTQWRYFGVDASWIALVAGLVAIMTASSARPSILRAALARVLDNRLATFGADISYSVYLLQGIFIALIGGTLFSDADFIAWSPHARTAALLVLVLASTTIAAIAVHRLVERPGIAAGRWLSGRIAVGGRAAVTPIA